MRNMKHAGRYLFYFPELGLMSVRENKWETFFACQTSRAVCSTLAMLFHVLFAPARQVWARKSPATTRSKVTASRRKACLATARMPTPTYILWVKAWIAHDACAEHACATSRSKVMEGTQG